MIEKATAMGRSFQEALISFKVQPLLDGFSSPAKILHKRSLIARKATTINMTAV